MKWVRWIRVILFVSFLIVGCSKNKLSEEGKVLVEQLINDYQVYFDFPLILNNYSASIHSEHLLINKETNASIYNGDRITLVCNGEAKNNEVIRVTGEYKDRNLNGIFVEIHSVPTEYNEDSLEQLAVTFLSEYNLAQEVSLMDQRVRENEREIIFRFQTEQDNIIKVYVNKDLQAVVGFLLTDSEDL